MQSRRSGRFRLSTAAQHLRRSAVVTFAVRLVRGRCGRLSAKLVDASSVGWGGCGVRPIGTRARDSSSGDRTSRSIATAVCVASGEQAHVRLRHGSLLSVGVWYRDGGENLSWQSVGGWWSGEFNANKSISTAMSDCPSIGKQRLYLKHNIPHI